MSNDAHPFLEDVPAKIVRVLLENPTVTYTKKDLMRAAGVSSNGFYNWFDDIVESGVIMRTDTGEGNGHWTLNPDSEMADALAQLIYGHDGPVGER
ncbi:hypothetical protein [Halomarina oriensis]|uniref:ArsR family transcriptional regulator n=1 Tax=Halomarina oriensis TaxID=671145 RepID=A0A6B0GL79_9EURY|nr:hypothetical protein [Halomarina oriensis]MWG35390.1 hypothetical protein [Halomarina oriensis]